MSEGIRDCPLCGQGDKVAWYPAVAYGGVVEQPEIKCLRCGLSLRGTTTLPGWGTSPYPTNMLRVAGELLIERWNALLREGSNA